GQSSVLSAVFDDWHDAKHFLQSLRDELGELILVGCYCEPYDAVSAGESFRNIQSEKACGPRVKQDSPRDRPRQRMREDGPKLISSDERLLVNVDLGQSTVLRDFRDFDGGEHFVVGSQVFGQDPV